METLYTNASDAIALMKEISMKVDFSDLYDLILRIPPQWLQFYDSKRLYKKGELFQVKDIKYLVEKDITIQDINVLTLEYFHPFQTKNISQWIYGEYIQKGMKRYSIENGKLYEATQFINYSMVDPGLTTDGKWILSESLTT